MARKNRYDWDQGEDEAEAPPAKPCWLCERPLGADVVAHHPVPRSRGGRATVDLHPICNQTLHGTFSNSQLARFGEDAAALRATPELEQFLGWIAGKDPDFHVPTTKRGGDPRRRGR